MAKEPAAPQKQTIWCVEDYDVKTAPGGKPQTYKAGKSYSLLPASAAHFLRKPEFSAVDPKEALKEAEAAAADAAKKTDEK